MKIVTDSGSLYSPEDGKELGIEVLPLNVIVNKKSYREFADISSQGFLELISDGSIPTTSQPSIGETMEVFENNDDEDLLVIHMADGLSGTYQSTLSIKSQMENPEHIHVINTMTLCGPEKYLVDKAIKLKNAGLKIEDLMKELHKSIATEKSYLIPQDFGFLKRGGRLTPLAATIGGMLKIVPVMTKTADGKKIEKFAIKKTMKAAVKEVIKGLQAHGVNEDFIIHVTHAGCLEQAQSIAKQIHESFEKVKIEMYELSPAFITQGGPGCIAIQTIKM